MNKRIAVLTTGGTIEKTFDESTGALRNERSLLDEILGRLRLPTLTLEHMQVMSKDSLEMTPADREFILVAVRAAVARCDAALVLHGTDTLEQTGAYLCTHLPELDRPVVLSGAMRPFEFRDSDALQNVTEALFAARVLPPGVYVVMHNQALRFPGPRKDRARGTFVSG